jgi:hypothetical protein
VFVNVHVFLCVCEQVEALQWANHPSKESHRPSWLRNWVKSALCSETGARSHEWEQRGRKKIKAKAVANKNRVKSNTVEHPGSSHYNSSNKEFSAPSRARVRCLESFLSTYFYLVKGLLTCSNPCKHNFINLDLYNNQNANIKNLDNLILLITVNYHC